MVFVVGTAGLTEDSFLTTLLKIGASPKMEFAPFLRTMDVENGR